MFFKCFFFFFLGQSKSVPSFADAWHLFRTRCHLPKAQSCFASRCQFVVELKCVTSQLRFAFCQVRVPLHDYWAVIVTKLQACVHNNKTVKDCGVAVRDSCCT